MRLNPTPPSEAQDVDWLALASSASISISGLSSTISHGGSDRYTVRVSGHGSLYAYFTVQVKASGALECSSDSTFRLTSSRTHSRTLSAYGCKAGTGTITAYLYFHSPDPKGGTSLADDDDQEVTVVGRPTPTPRPTNTPAPPTPTPTPWPTATPRPTNTPVPTAIPLPRPWVVTGLSVKAAASEYGPNRVQLGWSPVTGARRYIVQQSIDNGAWNVVKEPGRPPDPEARDSAAAGTGGVYYAPCDKPARYRVAAFGDGYLREAVRGPFSVTRSFFLQCSPFVGVTGGSAVTEGTNATFTLSTDIKPASVISVIVSISQIGDVTNATTTRSIPLSTTGTARFTVATIDDSTDEADGFVRAAIQSGKGYNILNASRTASVQVRDNDLPPTPTATATPSPTPTATPTPTSTPRPNPVFISIRRVGNSTITEGASASFALTASPKPTGNIVVRVAISQKGDFTETGTLSVPMGTGGKAIQYIHTDNDAVDEPDGSVTATLESGPGYLYSNRHRSATVNVLDNDSAFSVDAKADQLFPIIDGRNDESSVTLTAKLNGTPPSAISRYQWQRMNVSRSDPWTDVGTSGKDSSSLSLSVAHRGPVLYRVVVYGEDKVLARSDSVTVTGYSGEAKHIDGSDGIGYFDSCGSAANFFLGLGTNTGLVFRPNVWNWVAGSRGDHSVDLFVRVPIVGSFAAGQWTCIKGRFSSYSKGWNDLSIAGTLEGGERYLPESSVSGIQAKIQAGQLTIDELDSFYQTSTSTRITDSKAKTLHCKYCIGGSTETKPVAVDFDYLKRTVIAAVGTHRVYGSDRADTRATWLSDMRGPPAVCGYDVKLRVSASVGANAQNIVFYVIEEFIAGPILCGLQYKLAIVSELTQYLSRDMAKSIVDGLKPGIDKYILPWEESP